MWVLSARFTLHVPASTSLKDKRRVLRPVVDGLKSRFHCAAAEVDGQDTWQRAGLGVALVGNDAVVLRTALQNIERFVASHPGLEITRTEDTLWNFDDE